MLAERFILHTIKIDVDVEPPFLKASTYSQITITIIPKNSFGFRTPFSRFEARFEIEQGENLVELKNLTEKDKVILQSKGIEGEVIIGIYSLKSGILIRKLIIKIIKEEYA